MRKNTLVISSTSAYKANKALRRIGRCLRQRRPGTLLKTSLAAHCFWRCRLRPAWPRRRPRRRRSRSRPHRWGWAPQPAPPVAADWWKAFNDPQLDRLVAQLLAGNPTLQGALARIRAAQAELSVGAHGAISQHQYRRQRDAPAAQQRLSLSAAVRRLLAMGGRCRGALPLVAGFLGQAGGADRPRAQRQRGGGAGCRCGQAGAGRHVRPVLCRAAAGLAESGHRAPDGGRAPDHPGSDPKPGDGGAGERSLAGTGQGAAGAGADGCAPRRGAARHRRACHRGADRAGRRSLCRITRPAAAVSRMRCRCRKACRPICWRGGPTSWRRRRASRRRSRGRDAAHADFYPNIDLAAFAGFQAVGLANMFSGDRAGGGRGPRAASADLRCGPHSRPICPRHRRPGCRGGRLQRHGDAARCARPPMR